MAAIGYIVGAIGGAILADNAKARERRRKNAVRRTSNQGIIDLQPLYGEYRQQAAVAAGLRFDQVALQTEQARVGVDREMAGYGRTGFSNFDNPLLADPTARLQAIGLQNEKSMLQASATLASQLRNVDAAERQIRANAAQQGVVLADTDSIIKNSRLTPQEDMAIARNMRG